MVDLIDKIPTLKTVNYDSLIRLEGSIQLDAWKGFQKTGSFYSGLDKENKSNGIFSLDIGGAMVDEPPIVSQGHVNAYNYIVENQDQIKECILSDLLKEYVQLKVSYDYDVNTANKIMPEVYDIEQFKNLIGLSIVHIMNVYKDGIAYVGYEFGCTWDDEHGLGIMTHKDRIIDIGGADSSFEIWVANKDLRNSNLVSESPNKPWWKFWR